MMTHDEYDAVVAKVEATGLPYKTYPNTYQINITDVDGIIQSYYASKGTAVFRDGNDSYRSQRHTEHGMSIERFLDFCKGDEDIMDFFS